MNTESNLQRGISFLDPAIARRVIAHRGLSSAFPENTLSGFRAAEQFDGVHAIEFDVQLSRDEVPVVIHDETLERVCGDEIAVRDLDWTALSGIDAGSWFAPSFSEERIPSLSQVLAECPEVVLLVELKSYDPDCGTEQEHALVRSVANALRDSDGLHRSVILSFAPSLLRKSKEHLPHVPCMLNINEPPRDRFDSWIEEIREFQAVDFDIQHLEPNVVRTLHAAGLRVFTFTCNEDQQIRKACDCDVDGIISDFPGRVIEANRLL